jgi:NDP-sugar pyrophosphorylase family protein
MKIIVPMAGSGNRFLEKGYRDPKPLIKVGGKKIIEYVIDMFSPNDEFIFICNELHKKFFDIDKSLKKIKPSSKVFSMPNHKLGPVYTVLPFFQYIDDDEEVIISYCDNSFLWDIEDFKNFLEKEKPDGCILTHTGFHPHTLSKTKMAFIKEKDGIVGEIQEKECYTDDPMSEHASTGIYYFKKGSYVKKYFKELIDLDINYNGEYYVTLVYNLLIRDKLKCMYYDTPFVTVFGTPEEVEHFEAWKTLLSELQIKNEDDLINSYRYWKKYFKFYNDES